MKTYRYIVLTNPVDGQEAEFNRWYDEQHLADVLKVPGFKAAQRFKVAAYESVNWRYLAIYEFDSDDPEKTVGLLSDLAGTDAMPMSDALDMNSLGVFVVAPIGERVAT